MYHPKDYTHGAERIVIAERQRRDSLVLGGMFPPPIVRSPVAELYYAARCAVRYAAEARLSGAPTAPHLTRACRMRETARMLRAAGQS